MRRGRLGEEVSPKGKNSGEGMLAQDGDGKGGAREGATEDSESRLDVWLCFLSASRSSDL